MDQKKDLFLRQKLANLKAEQMQIIAKVESNSKLAYNLSAAVKYINKARGELQKARKILEGEG